jgi:hypothetical protein
VEEFSLRPSLTPKRVIACKKRGIAYENRVIAYSRESSANALASPPHRRLPVDCHRPILSRHYASVMQDGLQIAGWGGGVRMHMWVERPNRFVFKSARNLV